MEAGITTPGRGDVPGSGDGAGSTEDSVPERWLPVVSVPPCLKHFGTLPSEKHVCLPGPISLVEVLSLTQLQCLMLPTPFAVYLSIHRHIVPVDTSRCTSRSGVREGAGVGSGVLHCPPHPGASTPGRVSQPRAAPASSRPLCSTLFRAPGAINRGSQSRGEPAPLSARAPCVPGPP